MFKIVHNLYRDQSLVLPGSLRVSDSAANQSIKTQNSTDNEEENDQEQDIKSVCSESSDHSEDSIDRCISALNRAIQADCVDQLART